MKCVFEALAKKDKAAKEAGIIIMPGVGFDGVPSDCLAKHLKIVCHQRLIISSVTHDDIFYRGDIFPDGIGNRAT